MGRKKNDHLAPLLGWKTVQLFPNVVCEALQECGERRVRSKWKEVVEVKDSVFKMRATPEMPEQPSKLGTLFLKNCKQYGLACFGSSSKWLLTVSGAWGI